MKIWNRVSSYKEYEKNDRNNKEQMKILEFKNTTEMKNLLETFNSRFEHTDDRVSKHEDRSIKIIQSE